MGLGLRIKAININKSKRQFQRGSPYLLRKSGKIISGCYNIFVNPFFNKNLKLK